MGRGVHSSNASYKPERSRHDTLDFFVPMSLTHATPSESVGLSDKLSSMSFTPGSQFFSQQNAAIAPDIFAGCQG